MDRFAQGEATENGFGQLPALDDPCELLASDGYIGWDRSVSLMVRKPHDGEGEARAMGWDGELPVISKLALNE